MFGFAHIMPEMPFSLASLVFVSFLLVHITARRHTIFQGYCNRDTARTVCFIDYGISTDEVLRHLTEVSDAVGEESQIHLAHVCLIARGKTSGRLL